MSDEQSQMVENVRRKDEVTPGKTLGATIDGDRLLYGESVGS